MDWKKLAFKQIFEEAYSNKKINNIISIGDAEYEYEALINLYHTDHMDNKKYRLLKSVKFIRAPTRDILLDQIRVLQQASVKVCTIKKHLDLRFALRK